MDNMKKMISFISSAFAAVSLMALTVFADASVGESSGGNVPTGVNLDWLPVAIAAGVLVVVGVVSLIISKKKKK